MPRFVCPSPDSWASSVQFSSVVQSCPALCGPMDCSTPGFPVHHQLPEFTQTHGHWVGDATKPSHPSPPAFSLSQHQGLFKWVSSSHLVAKYWSFSFIISPSKEYSGSISFFFFPVLFTFLLYNIVLVLLYIDMNLPWVNMCSPSWTPLPPPSLSHPSGSSQCTSPEHPVSCIEPGLVIRFTYMFQCHSPISPCPRPLPQSPKDCSIHLCLFCCLAYRIIVTIILNPIYIYIYIYIYIC